MKKWFIGCMAMVLGTGAFAQVTTFSDGDVVLNATIGFGNTYYGSGVSMSFPSTAVSLELGIVDDLFDVEGLNLGVGGLLGIAGSKYEYNILGYNGEWKYTYILFGARGAMHYTFVDKLDTYAGVMIGFSARSEKYTGDDLTGIYSSDSYSGFIAGGYVGARYYFTDNFAALAELGYSIGFLNLGVSYKF